MGRPDRCGGQRVLRPRFRAGLVDLLDQRGDRLQERKCTCAIGWLPPSTWICGDCRAQPRLRGRSTTLTDTSVTAMDVVNARVWTGFHFRSADIASRDLGGRIAAWTLDHYFQPVDEKGQHDPAISRTTTSSP